MNIIRKFFRSLVLTLATSTFIVAPTLGAGLKLPAIFGDHMVLQREMALPIWGWASPGQSVTVEFAGQTVKGMVDENGRWKVKLAALKTSADPLEMIITAGSERRVLTDILVGEVWICSGQSNMQRPVDRSLDADLEKLTADLPQIRLLRVPSLGTQELQDDFKGAWTACTPETVGGFSAVGYFFGRQLYQTLGIPIGLINNAWGGSAAEAWVRRDVLEKDARFAGIIEQWRKTEATYNHETAIKEWKAAVAKARDNYQPLPPEPRNALTGQHRPGNIYAGVLNPTIGYGIRGVIWYQGESNAGRAANYRDLFPLMIEHWRSEWGQGDFPFYWVQLADFKDEVSQPGESSWAELREAQTRTLSLPNTGQAVIYDTGEGRDIHPRDKQTVGKRLARIALARDYGIQVPYLSPQYERMDVEGSKIVLTFKDVGGGLYSFDVQDPKGFAIAGKDKVWYWASARIVQSNQVEVWSDAVPAPVAVRYAWSDNPVATLRSQENLPVVPFRTDDWPMITASEVQ